MKKLLKILVENIVTNPKDVVIKESGSSSGEIVLELKVNPEDMGAVIGKGGKVIKAIRAIVRTKAILDGKRVNLILVEDR